jgi:tetratricopeptide (TPR) repeat protein
LFCSATWVRGQGDAASTLYNQGVTALQNHQYDDAAKAFETLIAGYKTSSNIDDAYIRLGFAYFFEGKYSEAVDRLSGEAAANAKPEYRPTALYYTALAQFYQGQKETDKTKANAAFAQAVTTLTSLIGLVTTAPTPANKGFLETAIYYRALAQFQEEDYDNAEKDLLQLIQQFPSSLSLPDYYLRLGSLYAVETNQAVTSKQTAEVVQARAKKALDAFDHVSTDPNALVQANEANMSKAEILFLIASLDSTPAGYEKALEAYRQVRRKADMIPLQQDRLDQLRKDAQAAAQAAVASNSLSNDSSLLIAREEGRLKDLQNGPDPIIQALIRMAECYVSLKQPDEARTILHRLVAHATLTPDQQQEVDFQTLYSYVLGGQTDQADQALTDYLGKHAGDPNADSISVLIAGKLMDRKDYAGALHQAQRSLKDFPQGKYAADAIGLEAQALTQLGRIKESDAVVDEFLKQDPTNPKANGLLLTRAQNKAAQGDLNGALTDYQRVRDNPSASPDIQAGADAGYIQTLNSLKRFDDVITEAKAFAAKYPTNTKLLPSTQLFAGMAMDQKHDPGAVAALQDVAKRYPKDDAASFALFYIVTIYQQANNVPAMIQAADDLRTAYPQAYPLLARTADAVSAVLLKQKKFDDAIALYQPLADAPKPDVAAAAHNKIGGVWLAAAKSMGYWQSMQLATRAEAEKTLSAAEQSYVETLKDYPDQFDAVGNAFDGLIATAKQRRSWGLLKDPDLEGYLAKLGADFTTPEMEARFEMAKAGLVFVYKNGINQYPAALDRFKKVIAANAGLRLTPQETEQFGELLLAAKDYPTALKVYGDLLDSTDPSDQVAQGDAYYGLGATYLAQGNVAQAKDYFLKLKAINGGAWHPHFLDADYGIALADEQSGQPAETDEARQIYSELMLATQGGATLQAKAMLGFGRLLEKAGNAIKPTDVGPNEYAVHYYQEPHTLYGPGTPEQSAEGLFDAGQAYDVSGQALEKAAAATNDTDQKKAAFNSAKEQYNNAKMQYDHLLENYGTTAPDWSAKAQAESVKVQAELAEIQSELDKL